MNDDADGVGHAGGPLPAALSVHRAFVVQFRDGPDPSSSIWQGRVEHVASGQSATFTSREDLLAFLVARMTAQPETGEPIASAEGAKPR